MKLLVTGGAGFAGSGLVKRMTEKGHDVTVLDIVAPLHAYSYQELKRIKYLWKGICDIEKSDVEDKDIVVHLQAQADVPMGHSSPKWTADENVMGIIHALESCRGTNIKKFVYAGSGNELGRPIYIPIDENHPLTPHNPYSFSKAAAEMAAWAYWRCYNIPIVVMSNGMCAGEGMRREIVLFKWLEAIKHGDPIYLQGGEQTRDITYVTDILDAWELVLEAPCDKVVGQKFQVSFGKELSMQEIMELCFEVTGKKVDVIRIPHRPGEKGQRECFSNQKARDVLGYNPRVDPKEAIRLTWEWVKNI